MIRVSVKIEPRGSGTYRMAAYSSDGRLFIVGEDAGILRAVDDVISLMNRHPEWAVSVSVPLRTLIDGGARCQSVAVPQQLELVLS